MAVDHPRLSIELVADLEGHDDRAWHLAWNPTRSILASCSADKTVRMYSYRLSPSSDTITFSHTTTIPTGHTKTVRGVAWSPSGTTLATASFDSNIGIWTQEDTEDDDQRVKGGDWECMSLLEGHETECKSVAYSNSGTLLASCSRDKTVWIWEVHPDSDFECMGVLMEHSQDVKCVAWHPSEEILASGSYDDTIKLYVDDPSDDWYCANTITGHESTVWTVAWEPERGRYLASGSDDNTIRIWKITGTPSTEIKSECVAVLTGHDRSVYSLSWNKGKKEMLTSDDGQESLGWLTSTSGDGSVKVWELIERQDPTGSKTKKIHYSVVASLDSAHGVFDVNSIAWCPRDGYENIFGTTGDDGHVKVWKVVRI